MPTSGTLSALSETQQVLSLRRDAATTGVVAAVAVLRPALSAAAGLLIAWTLPPEVYGEVAFFFAALGMIVMLASLGLTTQAMAQVAGSTGWGTGGEQPHISHSVLLARVLTLAALVAASTLALAAGQVMLGMAGIAAATVLASEFGMGIVQGLGHAKLAASLQLGQSIVYVCAIVFWGREHVYRVAVATCLSYLAVLLLGWPAYRTTLGSSIAGRIDGVSHWRSDTFAPLKIYLLALTLAPFTALVVFALGMAGRYEDAAAVSLALSLIVLLGTVAHTVIFVQFFPRACQLVAERSPGLSNWIDWFYRLFSAIAVGSFVICLAYPDLIITFLYTPVHEASAEPLRGMALAVTSATLGQFLSATLIACNQLRWAILGGGTQLLVLLILVLLAVTTPGVSSFWIGAGHSVAAMAGIVVWTTGLRTSAPAFDLHPKRLVSAILAAVGLCLLLGMIGPSMTDRTRAAEGAFLLLAGASIGAVTLAIFMPGSEGGRWVAGVRVLPRRLLRVCRELGSIVR